MHISSDRKAIIALRLHHKRSITSITANDINHIGNVIAHIGAILLDIGDTIPAHALVRKKIDKILVIIQIITLNILDIKLFCLGCEDVLSFIATIPIV